MAARKKKVSHGFGDYDRFYDHVLDADDDLRAAMTNVEHHEARVWQSLEGTSLGAKMRARQALGPAVQRLGDAIRGAETTDATSGYQLRRLPVHAPFLEAHRLLRHFERTLERARKAKSHAFRALRHEGGEEALRAALAQDRDRRRRARPNVSRRRVRR